MGGRKEQGEFRARSDRALRGRIGQRTDLAIAFCPHWDTPNAPSPRYIALASPPGSTTSSRTTPRFDPHPPPPSSISTTAAAHVLCPAAPLDAHHARAPRPPPPRLCPQHPPPPPPRGAPHPAAPHRLAAPREAHDLADRLAQERAGDVDRRRRVQRPQKRPRRPQQRAQPAAGQHALRNVPAEHVRLARRRRRKARVAAGQELASHRYLSPASHGASPSPRRRTQASHLVTPPDASAPLSQRPHVTPGAQAE